MRISAGLVLGALWLGGCGDAQTRVSDGPTASEAGSEAVIFDRANEGGQQIIEWVEAHYAGDSALGFADPVDQAAADFVQLALHMGRHDGDYVDAYHGPDVWKAAADALTPDAGALAADIDALATRLDGLSGGDAETRTRVAQLQKLTRAMGVRLQVIRGETVGFDTEVTEIYDEQVPAYDLAEYDVVLAEIDALLPGEGSTADRVDAFRNSLAIPEDKLQTVFDRAIAECRARTAAHYDLPEGEKFRMEFVSDKSWSGYNYYQGGYESLIQINTDFPIIIDRAVDLGCHEGYPGHHVWNLFIERELVGERGWIEYSVNPLFGPFGPIAEGSANYGIELAFPGDEKIAFERDVLFPLAGLDPEKADMLQQINRLSGQLSHATNEVARQYLNGELGRDAAIAQIQHYSLASAERSAQRLSFFEKYRGYVINYNIGRDRAGSWVEAAGDDQTARWAAFEEMLTRPMTPSDIIAALE